MAFVAILAVAGVTSILAGWGLVSSSSMLSSNSLGGVPFAALGSASSSTVMGSESESAGAQGGPANASTTTGTSTVTAAGSVTTMTTTVSAAATTTQAGGESFGAVAALSSASSQSQSLLREVQRVSLLLAPVSWVVLAGMWVWRGRVRARYSEMGFGSDVFELFMKMKGGATRIRVLNKLSTPKDRLQLAEELGVDWKTVDRHVQILNRYGFVSEQAAYGTVRLYEVTPMGKMLLDLFEDLERTDGPVVQQQPNSPRSHDDSGSGP
jgi:hypothetical protein